MLPTSRRDPKSLLKSQLSLLTLSNKYFERKPFFGKQDRERKLIKQIRIQGKDSLNRPPNRGNYPISKWNNTKHRNCQSPIKKIFTKNFKKIENNSVKNQFEKSKKYIDLFDNDIYSNINDEKTEIPMEGAQQKRSRDDILRSLFSNKESKESPKLFKLAGTDTRSIKAAHQALITYFGLQKNKVGGIALFEGLNYWVFLAFPSDIRGIDNSLNHNKYGVQITGWTLEELTGLNIRLAIYANNISKNKKEFSFAKQGAKNLLGKLELNDIRALESVIQITQNLNKENLNYSVFNLIENNKTEIISVKENLIDNSKQVLVQKNLRKRGKPLLIIPEQLWNKENQEARDLFVEQHKRKVSKTSEEPDAKLRQKGLPRRHDPGNQC